MAHAQASAGKGCIMKVVRTRFVVALGSSAVLASGFGLTALAGNCASQGITILTASQSVIQPCLNGTITDYCTQK
jgi:hypothetical protein